MTIRYTVQFIHIIEIILRHELFNQHDNSFLHSEMNSKSYKFINNFQNSPL